MSYLVKFFGSSVTHSVEFVSKRAHLRQLGLLKVYTMLQFHYGTATDMGGNFTMHLLTEKRRNIGQHFLFTNGDTRINFLGNFLQRSSIYGCNYPWESLMKC